MKTLFFFIMFLVPSLSIAAKNITLSLGETHKIVLRGSPSIWIQNRNVIKADGLGSQLILKAQNEGQTILKVGTDIYQIQVLHPLKTDSADEFRQFLKSIVGLSVHVADGDLQVKGTLYRLQDWVKIANFARQRNFSYHMKAEIPAALQTPLQDYFSERLAEAKLPPQSLIFSPSVEVRMKASELSAKKYDQLFTSFGIPVIRDQASLEIAPTVKVEITVAEVNRSFSRQLGVAWPQSYSANILPNGTWQRGSVEMSLQVLENTGEAKVLASPNLLCRSGEEAEFLAGGEFPIKVIGYKSESVMWRKYGISLKVKPKADASGRISLSIETEVTSIDMATKMDNIPGLKTHRVSSHFDLTRPQTIALSGLIKNEDSISSQGLPWVSKLPVFGALFSSKNFVENKSELVIFVRPSIVQEENESTSLAHLKEKI